MQPQQMAPRAYRYAQLDSFQDRQHARRRGYRAAQTRAPIAGRLGGCSATRSFSRRHNPMNLLVSMFFLSPGITPDSEFRGNMAIILCDLTIKDPNIELVAHASWLHLVYSSHGRHIIMT